MDLPFYPRAIPARRRAPRIEPTDRRRDEAREQGRRAVRVRRRARRFAQRLVAQEHVRAVGGARRRAHRMGRGGAGAPHQRPRQVRQMLDQGARWCVQLHAPGVRHAGVRRRAGSASPASRPCPLSTLKSRYVRYARSLISSPVFLRVLVKPLFKPSRKKKEEPW
jgi:hypothetical protein